MSNPKSVRAYERPPDSPVGGNHVRDVSPAKQPCVLQVDGHVIPYIELSRLDPTWVRREYDLGALDRPEKDWASQDARRNFLQIREALDRGEPLYLFTLDGRFGHGPIPESEINRWAWFLANAMAVSAGYTSHGENSRRRNPHGVSRK